MKDIDMIKNDLRIVYPEWFDELAEFEHEKKGYLEGVIVFFKGRKINFTFYDITRLSQDFEYECISEGFSYFEKLVILSAVTKKNISHAVNKILKLPN